MGHKPSGCFPSPAMNRKKQSSESNSSSKSDDSQGVSNTESSKERRRRKWGNYIPERRKFDPRVPYIIRPRCTALLDPRPMLQWNEVAQTSGYIVSLSRAEQCLWEIETEATQIEYPGEPALMPKTNYTLLVQTDAGTFSNQDKPLDSIPFNLLSEAERQQVEAEVQQVQAVQTGEAQMLAVAEIYTKHRLRAEAIDLLELAVTQGNRRMVIYQTRGEFYMDVGLHLNAGAPYKQAIKLAKNAGNIEAQAFLAARLGKVYVVSDDRREALYWFNQAKYGYEGLGHMDAVEGLENAIAELIQ